MWDHLWGTKELPCCWSSGLMVASFQLVKSQRSLYLISRVLKPKRRRDSGYQGCCLLQAQKILAFSSGMSPDLDTFWGLPLSGGNMSGIQQGVCLYLSWQGGSHVAWEPTLSLNTSGPRGQCQAARWHLLESWEFSCLALRYLGN